MQVEDLNLVEKVGKGSFGEVYLTKKKNSDMLYATKKVPKSLVMQDKIKRYFNNEIFILKNVDHPNIIKLYEIKQTINNFYLVFDFCNGGGLSDCLKKYQNKYGRPFSEEIVQHIMKKIMSGLHYLHKNKIIHRDLKLDNILVYFPIEEDKKNVNMLNSEIKIIDFGFARYLQNDDLAQSVLGSPINMDPQILQKLRKIDNKEGFGYDEKADIWSIGTIAYELLIGLPPFDANSYDELLDKINKGNYFIPSSVKLSKQSISFLNGLLQYDPKQRLGVDDLIYHEFLTLDASKFETVDLTRLSKQYSNTKELIMSTKDNKHLWFLFETPGFDEDPSNITGKMISGNAIKNQGNRLNANNMVKEKEEDFIGSLISGINKINIKRLDDDFRVGDDDFHVVIENNETTQIKNINPMVEANQKNQANNKLPNNYIQIINLPKEIDAKLIQETFDFMNKDFYNLEPMLVPICPETPKKFKELDL